MEKHVNPKGGKIARPLGKGRDLPEKNRPRSQTVRGKKKSAKFKKEGSVMERLRPGLTRKTVK